MIGYLKFALCLIIHIAQAQPPNTHPDGAQQWKTLSGKRPLVIARGGMSGVLPDSSVYAYMMASGMGIKDTVMFCDLQLTKDSIGFCLSEIRLDNTSNVAIAFPNASKTYDVNGKSVTSWFAVDYTAQDLFSNVLLVQSTLSRTDMFDGISQLVTLDDLMKNSPANVWVNVQYDAFYNQHQVSPETFIGNYPNLTNINFISSPEIGFLKAINDKAKGKLIFRFLQPDATEPTTKQPYSSFLKNLTAIKDFASGILVPKDYIVPVGKDLYLLPSTQLVKDAHDLGLEIYASGFINDVQLPYNYSYDPTQEYLQFVDNEFSVDGVLTDFANTASEAIGCLAHNKNAPKPEKGLALVISHNGASGNYPGCTDLAYEKAANDGADIIDCSVQMSKDGIAFCSPSADLTKSTTAITKFMSQSTTVPEVQQQPGIFSFNLAWSEIQSLKPQIASFQLQQGMPRNPIAKNKGKFMTLANFLELAKTKAVPGILINIKNTAYLASKKGLDIIKAVNTTLQKAAFDKQSTQTVFIQSEDSAVLSAFKDTKSYRKVYAISQEITSMNDQVVEEIKKFADTIDFSKNSLIILNAFFTLNETKLVKQMHAANISVHVSVLYNEFMTMPFDMCADPVLNVATFVAGLGVDGVVTEYPETAVHYMRNPCLNGKSDYQIEPITIGTVIGMIGGSAAPLQAPAPLDASEVVSPPLPPVSAGQSSSTPSEDKKSAKNAGGRGSEVSLSVCIVLALMYSSLLWGCKW